jgi:hypothetical protein
LSDDPLDLDEQAVAPLGMQTRKRVDEYVIRVLVVVSEIAA